MSPSASSRAAAVAGLLVCTWSAAVAQTTPNFTLMPTESMTDFRTVAVNINETTSAVEAITVGANVGAIPGGTTTVVSAPVLSPATSVQDMQTPASVVFGFGLTTDGSLITTARTSGPNGTNAQAFSELLTGDLATFKGFVTSGDVVGLTSFIDGNVFTPPSSSQVNKILSISPERFGDDTGGGLLKFTDAGSPSIITGQYVYDTVPEPASMAVLGLGLAALRRRRR